MDLIGFLGGYRLVVFNSLVLIFIYVFVIRLVRIMILWMLVSEFYIEVSCCGLNE